MDTPLSPESLRRKDMYVNEALNGMKYNIDLPGKGILKNVIKTRNWLKFVIIFFLFLLLCSFGYIIYKTVMNNDSNQCVDSNGKVLKCGHGVKKGTHIPCKLKDCVVDCQVEWDKEWSTCVEKDASANTNTDVCTGTQEKLGKIIKHASGGGKECPTNLVKTRDCKIKDCKPNPTPPVSDCTKGEWSKYGECGANEDTLTSLNCGDRGKKTRTRVLTGNCDSSVKSVETKDCVKNCPAPDNVDCVLSDWSPWSDKIYKEDHTVITCKTKDSDHGYKYRTRTVITPSKGNGAQCNVLVDYKEVDLPMCANPNPNPQPQPNPQPPPTKVDCVLSDWEQQGTCSKQCDSGILNYIRRILTQPQNGGKACDSLTKTEPCNTQPCAQPPVDCETSDWVAQNECSAPCGSGTQNFTRTIIKQAQNGGHACGVLTKTETCNTNSCPIVPTKCQPTSNYTPWSDCKDNNGNTITCGSGVQTRKKILLNDDGTCNNPILTQVCNLQPCAPENVDCRVSDFGSFETCAADCTQTRTRTILTQPKGSGAACPSLTDTKTCFGDACPCSSLHSTGYNKTTRKCVCKGNWAGDNCNHCSTYSCY